jgi:hypothetical protein
MKGAFVIFQPIVITNIAKYCNLNTLNALQRVCKKFNETIKSSGIIERKNKTLFHFKEVVELKQVERLKIMECLNKTTQNAFFEIILTSPYLTHLRISFDETFDCAILKELKLTHVKLVSTKKTVYVSNVTLLPPTIEWLFLSVQQCGDVDFRKFESLTYLWFYVYDYNFHTFHTPPNVKKFIYISLGSYDVNAPIFKTTRQLTYFKYIVPKRIEHHGSSVLDCGPFHSLKTLVCSNGFSVVPGKKPIQRFESNVEKNELTFYFK